MFAQPNGADARRIERSELDDVPRCGTEDVLGEAAVDGRPRLVARLRRAARARTHTFARSATPADHDDDGLADRNTGAPADCLDETPDLVAHRDRKLHLISIHAVGDVHVGATDAGSGNPDQYLVTRRLGDWDVLHPKG